MKISRSIVLLTTCLVLLLASEASAESDVQMWNKLKLRVEPIDFMRVDLSGQLRLSENLSSLDSLIPQLGVSFRLTPFLRLGAGYRITFTMKNDGEVKKKHRFQFDGILRFKPGPLRIKARLRFQQARTVPLDEHIYQNTLREKLSVGWKTPLIIDPFLATEAFQQISNEQGFDLDKWRIDAGVTCRLGWHKVSTYYRLELPILDQSDPIVHIIGVSYLFEPIKLHKQRIKSK